MSSLLTVIPNPSDITSSYRAMGPFGQLLNSGACDFEMLFVNEQTYVYDELCYLAKAGFMQRPCNERHMKIARMIKDNRRPLWIDHDDNLFDVPRDNASFSLYSDHKIQKYMREIIAMADIVSVASPTLRDKIEKISPGKDIRIIPNAIDLERFNQKTLEKRNNYIFWRGSKTHQRDVSTVAIQMLKAYKEYPEYKWVFHGDSLWFITNHMLAHDPERVIFPPEMSFVQYHQNIIEMAPKIFIAPLVDQEFNYSKSNIAFLEATFCGALCLAPDMPEWRFPGCLNYTTSEGFYKKLCAVLEAKAPIDLTVSTDNVKKLRSLSVVNKLREQIIKEIMA